MKTEFGEEQYREPLPFTIEEAEDQMTSLAVNLAISRLKDGTASNQLIAEIIRAGSSKERLQKEKLKKENDLLRAKTEAIKSQKNTEEFYSRVLDALKSYAPSIYNPEAEDDYDD